MTYKEAKRILHPDTTREALAEIEFFRRIQRQGEITGGGRRGLPYGV